MNNIVGSIFYESFVKNKGFVDLVNSARDPIEKLKKKEKERGRRKCVNVERNPNGALVTIWKAFSPACLRLVFKR